MPETIAYTEDGIKTITVESLKELPDFWWKMNDNLESAIEHHRKTHQGNNPPEIWILNQKAPFKPIYYIRSDKER